MNTSLISLNVDGIQEAVRQAIREEIGKQVKNMVIQTEPVQPEYYERKQLCELAHISPSTLWRMEEDGIIQKLKFGRRNRVGSHFSQYTLENGGRWYNTEVKVRA